MHVEPEELHANRRSHPEDIWTVLRHGARQGRITHMARLEGKDPSIFAAGTPKWNLNKNPVKDIPRYSFFLWLHKILGYFPAHVRIASLDLPFFQVLQGQQQMFEQFIQDVWLHEQRFLNVLLVVQIKVPERYCLIWILPFKIIGMDPSK